MRKELGMLGLGRQICQLKAQLKASRLHAMPGTIHDPIGGQSRAAIAAKQAKPQPGRKVIPMSSRVVPTMIPCRRRGF